jgi:hypothetical protein
VAEVAINMPPPAMMPSSVHPAKAAQAIAKNAAALVTPAVIMLVTGDRDGGR